MKKLITLFFVSSLFLAPMAVFGMDMPMTPEEIAYQKLLWQAAQKAQEQAQIAAAIAESKKQAEITATKTQAEREAAYAALALKLQQEYEQEQLAAAIAESLKQPTATAITAPKPVPAKMPIPAKAVKKPVVAKAISRKPFSPASYMVLKATQQAGIRFGGGSCGAHALNNAFAFQQLFQRNEPITSAGMQKNMACFYIHEEALSNQTIKEEARTNGLINLFVIGRARAFKDYEKLGLTKDQIVPMNEKIKTEVTWKTMNNKEIPGTRKTHTYFDDTIQKEIATQIKEINSSPDGIIHFVLAIVSGYGPPLKDVQGNPMSDHWVLISVIKSKGKARLYYVDSNNKPPYPDAQGFLKYVYNLVD